MRNTEKRLTKVKRKIFDYARVCAALNSSVSQKSKCIQLKTNQITIVWMQTPCIQQHALFCFGYTKVKQF